MTLLKDIKTDFSPRYGSLLRAITSFIGSMITFVVIPFVVFNFMAIQMSGAGLNNIMDETWLLVQNMIKFSVPMVLLSIPIGFYRPGSYARVPFKVLSAIYLASWLRMVSNNGILLMEMSEEITVVLDISMITYIVMMIAFAKVFLAFSECGGKRKEYLEKIDKKKDTMAKRKARRLSD